MDFLNARTFEIFRYVIPGAMILLFLFFDFRYNYDVYRLIADSKDIGLLFSIILLLVSYVIGLFVDEFIYRILKVFKKLKRKEKRDYKSLSSLTISEKYTSIRENSKENFIYVEYWNALKGMCHNLMGAGIYMSIILILDLISFGMRSEVVIFLIVLIAFSYLMLMRGNLYDNFADSELDSSIDYFSKNSPKD